MLRQPSLKPITITPSCVFNAIGFEEEGLKKIIEDARLEDRNHFETLVPKIYELGGELHPSLNAPSITTAMM